jgi:Xaa-Pro aminopeptidase
VFRLVALLICVAGTAVAQTLPAVPEIVPALPGAGRTIDRDATRARRDRLLQRIGQGVVIVRASTQRDLEDLVLQDNDFRQNDYFFYLTGLESPDAWLIMTARPGAVGETHLLLPERNPRAERWTGPKLGPGEGATRLTGISNVYAAEELDAVLATASRAAPGPVYVLLDARALLDPRIEDWLGSHRDIRNVRPIIDSLRVVKDADELDRLRRAIDITVEAQKAAMRAAEPGNFEYQLEAVIEYTFRYLGADRVGFPSIVGSGPNSTILHYDVNRRRIEAGDLVVMDIGAEYGQYTADVTRTIPVGGRFTERQKAIYNLVYGAQQAAIDAVQPGVTIGELSQIARRYIDEHSGDLCGASSCNRYFIHGLSHWLGMRVHDVGDYRMPLEPGMVLTIEPGIYIPEEDLGVRIEDDVLVTDTGSEILSAGAPRTAEDVEELMRERPHTD